MKRKIKYTLVILMGIILVIIIACIIIIAIPEYKEEYQEKTLLKTYEESDINNYIYVNNIIRGFLDYANEQNDSQALISLLDKEFLEEQKLDSSNILKYFKEYKEVTSFCSKEIYIQEIGEGQEVIGRYIYAKGVFRKNATEEYKYILLKEDLIRECYSIRFLEEKDFKNEKEDISNKIEINIEKNNYNSIPILNITDYSKGIEFFTDYINIIKNNPEKGYYILDKDYREKKFGSADNYVEYINGEQKDKLFSGIISCSLTQEGKISVYRCIDSNSNCYIFKVTKGMDYSLKIENNT